MELFVSVETCCFVESILVYKLLALSEFLRAKFSLGLGKNNIGICLISSSSQLWGIFLRICLSLEKEFEEVVS